MQIYGIRSLGPSVIVIIPGGKLIIDLSNIMVAVGGFALSSERCFEGAL